MGDGNQIRMGIIVCVLITVLTGISMAADDAAAMADFLNPGAPVPQCPKNEYYKRCLGNCSNCEQRGMCPPQTFQCSQSGCDCSPHYVRLTPGGKCEPVSKCPIPTCGENEIYRPCGPVCERCSTLKCHLLSCDFKCYCKEGFLRDVAGKCIPEDECPPRTRCSFGELPGASGPTYNYCLRDETQEVSNATIVKEGCYCQDGFKRNLMGHCTEYCQFSTCRNGEVFSSCPRKCNTTCHNYGDTTCKEDGMCYPGCFCPEGTILDRRSCIRPEKCPPGSNSLAPTVAPTTPEMQTESSTGGYTTPMPTESTVVTVTTTAEDPTTNIPSGKSDDDGKTTDSDFATEASDTIPKPTKFGKGGKSHSVAQTEAKAEASKNVPKSVTKNPKFVTPESGDENE